jgi:hypothetical protein
MPDTKDFHGAKNILLDNEDWMVVDPLDYDAFVYYAPEYMKSKWSTYREGDTYFIIDKNYNELGGFRTYAIHKTEGGVEYFWYSGRKINSKKGFIDDFPDEIQSVVDEIIGHSDIYKLLVKINNGEQVSSRELENADESIYDFKYTPKAPFKSKITFRFDKEEYIKLFDPSEDDLWYYNAITSRYDSYEFEDGSQAIDDFQQGYLKTFIRGKNLVKLKEILSIILPDSVSLDTDTRREEAGKKLYDMFDDEIENITYDYTTEVNQCKTRAFEKMINDDFCNAFYNDGIYTRYCLTEYFTSAGILLDLYDTIGDKTLTIQELLFRIGSDMNIVGWGENIYELDCDDFDYESLDTYVSNNLDKIMEKLEDESKYVDIYEYSELYKRLSSKFKINSRYFTDYKRDFFYRGIDPTNNKIRIQVFKKEGGLENRSYTEEEFNNFLVSPELFESRKRRISEQTTGTPAINFITSLSKVDPTLFNTKKPLMFLQNKLSEYNSKNNIKLDMNTLVKQLSSPSSPFKFTTFNIQTYEPKRVSTLDVNLKNIGFTLTKNGVNGSLNLGVKKNF